MSPKCHSLSPEPLVLPGQGGQQGEEQQSSVPKGKYCSSCEPVELMGRSGGLSVHGASVGARDSVPLQPHWNIWGFFPGNPKPLGGEMPSWPVVSLAEFLYPVGNVPVWE